MQFLVEKFVSTDVLYIGFALTHVYEIFYRCIDGAQAWPIGLIGGSCPGSNIIMCDGPQLILVLYNT